MVDDVIKKTSLERHLTHVAPCAEIVKFLSTNCKVSFSTTNSFPFASSLSFTFSIIITMTHSLTRTDTVTR
ncbi:hypothetical protein RIF29_16603 [Crotalaria pallida]|uniref:Uncharacterized protein n=1 Tax=Crotalaria pallida TaxID=3830 RepID=A0AAN9IEL8_CROPI